MQIIIRLQKIKPIRAAKIFGPALILFSLNLKYETMLFEDNAIGLYFVKSDVLKKKSNKRIMIGTGLHVRPKDIRKSTVKSALIRATRSFILLSETGHTAKDFIPE